MMGGSCQGTHTAPGVSAAPKDAGTAQHVSAAHPTQLSQHNVPAHIKGHHPLGTNWGSQLTGDEDELAGPENGTAGALSPITAHLTARLLSARTGVQTVVCKERHAEGWRGRRLRCSLLVV